MHINNPKLLEFLREQDKARIDNAEVACANCELGIDCRKCVHFEYSLLHAIIEAENSP